MTDFRAQWLPLLQGLPRPLAALLLQQVLRRETMFPREKSELEATLTSLLLPRSAELDRAVAAFQALRVPAAMSNADWQKEPSVWLEGFTVAMWSSGQIEAYRNAAKLAVPPSPPSTPGVAPRAVVVVLDKHLKTEGASTSLFRRLRSAGTLFSSVQASADAGVLQAWMVERGRQSKEAYSNWYVGGDDALKGLVPSTSLATLTYTALEPARHRLLSLMNEARLARGTGGPEGLRRSMQVLTPDEMGLAAGTDLVLRRFATDVLVGGSGTQLYATTFVQWAAREILRRAQPHTLVARFTARNQSAAMDLRLAQPMTEPPLEFGGSLVDAEMGAYLTYLNLLRLPGAERAHFLAWHEGYGQAVLIGRAVAADARHVAPVHLGHLLTQMS